MIDEFQNKRVPNGNESINRVVDDFALECQEKKIRVQKYSIRSGVRPQCLSS
jgi:hypothetical protein